MKARFRKEARLHTFKLRIESVHPSRIGSAAKWHDAVEDDGYYNDGMARCGFDWELQFSARGSMRGDEV
jgi:hypothetical protein